MSGSGDANGCNWPPIAPPWDLIINTATKLAQVSRASYEAMIQILLAHWENDRKKMKDASIFVVCPSK